jgi:hypothetical protein
MFDTMKPANIEEAKALAKRADYLESILKSFKK